jgi:hypothetical protein
MKIWKIPSLLQESRRGVAENSLDATERARQPFGSGVHQKGGQMGCKRHQCACFGKE